MDLSVVAHTCLLLLWPMTIPSPLINKIKVQETIVQNHPIVTVPFQTIGGLIVVPVRINGSRPLNMILDTGMSAPIIALFHLEIRPCKHLEHFERTRSIQKTKLFPKQTVGK